MTVSRALPGSVSALNSIAWAESAAPASAAAVNAAWANATARARIMIRIPRPGARQCITLTKRLT